MIISPTRAEFAHELVARAEARLRAESFAEAEALCLQALKAEPAEPTRSAALYYLALSRDFLQRHPEAARSFSAVSNKSPYFVSASVRAVRLWTFLDEVVPAGAQASRLLAAKQDLAPLQEIVALSAIALAELEQGRTDRAEASLTRARGLAERHAFDSVEPISRDIAHMHYALGELRRTRAAAVSFSPFPEDFGATFELRAQAVLDAQSAYLSAMRAHDARWSARAGFRVGELYTVLHQEIRDMPLPDVRGRLPSFAADAETQQYLFYLATRLKYRVLLKKGLEAFTRTREMTDRTGDASVWAQRSAESEAQLRRTLAEEDAALESSPIPRSELARVLTELQARSP